MILAVFCTDVIFNTNKPLERESLTNLINKFIKQSAKEIEGQPVLSSHSFRIGFISKLWRDTSDIEFVRQVVGHAKNKYDFIICKIYVQSREEISLIFSLFS